LFEAKHPRSTVIDARRTLGWLVVPPRTTDVDARWEGERVERLKETHPRAVGQTQGRILVGESWATEVATRRWAKRRGESWLARARRPRSQPGGGPNTGANPGLRECSPGGLCRSVSAVTRWWSPKAHRTLPNAHSLCLMSPTCVCTGTAAGKGRRQVVGRGWDV